MLSRSLLHLRRQCQQELIKSGKYTKEITNLYHKGSQGDKGSFWSEFVPFLIRASQRNHYQPHQAPQNQVTHEFDWQNFTDFIKRFNQRGPIQRNTEQVSDVLLLFCLFYVTVSVPNDGNHIAMISPFHSHIGTCTTINVKSIPSTLHVQ